MRMVVNNDINFDLTFKSYTYIPLFRLPYKAVLTKITVPTLQRNFAKLCSHVDMLVIPLGAGKQKKKTMQNENDGNTLRNDVSLRQAFTSSI